MVNPEYWKGECGGPNCFNGAFMEKGFPSTKPRAGRLDGMIEVSGKIDKCYVGENAPLNTGNLQTPNTTFFSVDALLLNPQYATLDYIGRLFNIVSLSTLSTHELEAVTLYFKTLTVMYLNGTIKKCWAPQVLPAL